MSFEVINNFPSYLHQQSQRVVSYDVSSGLYSIVDFPEEWDYEPEVENPEDSAPMTGEFTRAKPSEFVSFAMMMPDKEEQKYKRFSFEGRGYLRHIYDTPSDRTLLKCGRQVEKSTLLGNKLLSYSCLVQALNSLYVAPTNQQTKVFSQDRLKEPVETSEILKSWTTTKLSDNVFLKKFVNRSQITLRYCYMSADRVRGIPADLICIDELQDIITDNIPIIEECASHSNMKIFMYSGTPKSFDNPIEFYWTEFSTQNEWAVPCHRHSIQTGTGTKHLTRLFWNILGEENIGHDHLICSKCEEPINPDDPEAQWVSMNPEVWKSLDKPYEGFRIPQIMVPWITMSDVRQKQRTYTRAKFHNEVLGLSYDSGTRPLTRRDIQANCDPNLHLDEAFQRRLHDHLKGGQPIFAGVDWGSAENSYTVISLGTYLMDRFSIFYVRRLEGRESEPDVMIDIVKKMIGYWKVHIAGVDYGGGFYPNDDLIREFGFRRIAKYQYSTPNAKVRWEDGLKRFLVNRTEVMSDIFNAIKRRTVFRFPAWEEFANPYAQDMLNIFSEYNEQRREDIYKKSPGATDDTFHSVLYCFLASMLVTPRPDVVSPMRPGRNT